MAKTRFKDTQWIPTLSIFAFPFPQFPARPKACSQATLSMSPSVSVLMGFDCLNFQDLAGGGGVRGLDSCALMPYPLSPIPFLFLFFSIPFNHFRRLLRRLKQKDMETTMNYLPRQRQQNNTVKRHVGFFFGLGKGIMRCISSYYVLRNSLIL